ncbi:hypothetical protein Hypma_005470 [Hypsizygus marmoreus]|uniref:Uncharacterized protein n=1 Tax=Hypsizygus marmoreus TaxID=39966 RepID=A0A369J890_HYPMA|nr:hypothetical protein Hypma_005470 [Hypsizygus marmoreus]
MPPTKIFLKTNPREKLRCAQGDVLMVPLRSAHLDISIVGHNARKEMYWSVRGGTEREDSHQEIAPSMALVWIRPAWCQRGIGTNTFNRLRLTHHVLTASISVIIKITVPASASADVVPPGTTSL